MGQLRRHPIREWKHTHGLRSFVETGTWRGDALVHAAPHFGYLASVDVDPGAPKRAQDQLRKAHLLVDGMHVLNLQVGDSSKMLDLVLDELPQGPALFWLDAHLPERYGQRGTKLPLAEEVWQIVAHPRDHTGDVILMDDLRLYQRGPYANGDFPGPVEYKDLMTLRYLLEPTHRLFHDMRDEGYLIALPGAE